MKTKYAVCLASVLIISVAALITVKSTSLLQSWRFRQDTPKRIFSGNVDSVTIILLNKKAFDLRFTDPFKTVTIATQSLQLARTMDYKAGIAEAYRVIGLGFSYSGNDALAVQNYLYSLKYFSILGDETKIARLYNNIGNLYKIDDYNKALYYYTNALKIAQKINNIELVGGIFFNIATLESNMDKRKALDFFERSFKIFRSRDDTTSIITYYQNTANIHIKLNHFNEANWRLRKAIAAAKAKKMYLTLAGCYSLLAKVYLSRNEFYLSRASIAEGMKYSRMTNTQKMDVDFLRRKYELEMKRRNYKAALIHLSAVYHKDSLLLNKSRSAIINFNSKYFLQQQTLQAKELIITKQKYNESILKWTMIVSSLVILVGGMFGIILILIWQKKKKKNDAELQSKIASSEQKALQAMMNPHFVFNVMTSIQYFVNQADSKMANYTLSRFAQLARQHLEICMSSTISVGEELQYLTLYLSLEKVRFSDKMDYEISVDDKIDAEDTQIPSMLIQPFVENAVIHGITPMDNGGQVKLNFGRDDDEILISIVDNGVGIVNSQKSKNGHVSRGIALIRERVDLINQLNKRQISINQRQLNQGGTEVLIRIPA